jgi:hypothetical protein
MPRRKNAEYTRKPLPQTIDDVFAEFGVVDDATQVQGDRGPINVFYRKLNDLYPGNTVVYIPPPESIHPKLSEEQQAFVFADCAIRRIAPIALDAVGLKAEAAKLRKLSKIVDYATAAAAHSTTHVARAAANPGARAAAAAYAAAANRGDRYGYSAAESAHYAAASAADRYGYSVVPNAHNVARNAAYAANAAAELNPEATWDAVTDMLYAL